MSDIDVQEFIDGLVRDIGNIDSDDDELQPDSHLMDEGFIDSLGLVNVVLGIEKRYGVRFSDADMGRTQFGTIAGLAGLVREKLGE